MRTRHAVWRGGSLSEKSNFLKAQKITEDSQFSKESLYIYIYIYIPDIYFEEQYFYLAGDPGSARTARATCACTCDFRRDAMDTIFSVIDAKVRGVIRV